MYVVGVFPAVIDVGLRRRRRTTTRTRTSTPPSVCGVGALIVLVEPSITVRVNGVASLGRADDELQARRARREA